MSWISHLDITVTSKGHRVPLIVSLLLKSVIYRDGKYRHTFMPNLDPDPHRACAASAHTSTLSKCFSHSDGLSSGENVGRREAVWIWPAVALTQISVYSTHTNLAVRKIMEAMRTAKRKKKNGTRSQHVSNKNMAQTITEHRRVCGKRASFAKNFLFR